MNNSLQELLTKIKQLEHELLVELLYRPDWLCSGNSSWNGAVLVPHKTCSSNQDDPQPL